MLPIAAVALVAVVGIAVQAPAHAAGGATRAESERAGLDRPALVSPGARDQPTTSRSTNPSFSWAAVAGAIRYELVVFDMKASTSRDGDEAGAVIHVSLPGAATAWTAPAESSLVPGGEYAWMLRAIRAPAERDGGGGGGATTNAGPWSVAHYFRVAEGPDPEDVYEALEVLRRYLGDVESERGLGESRGDRRAAARAPSGRYSADLEPAGLGAGPMRKALPLVTATSTGLKATPVAESGVVFGVHGVTQGPDPGSAGVVGEATATSGDVIGVVGISQSPEGAGGSFGNSAGGDILRGYYGEELVFTVQKDGSVIASSFQGDGGGLSNVPVGPHGHAGQYVALSGDLVVGADGDIDVADLTSALDGHYVSHAQAVVDPGDIQARKAALLQWQRRDFPVGSGPEGVAFDGVHVWVANSASHNVTKLRAIDGANQGTFPVGDSPAGVAFDGANIWVANRGSNDVTKLRAHDGANQGTFPVGTHPLGVVFDGSNIWVTNHLSHDVTKLRASDGAELGVFSLAPATHPRGAAFDGTYLWVAVSSAASVITKVRVSDGATLPGGLAGLGPDGVAFDGANIWVANNGSNDVSKLRASDGASLGTFPAGLYPSGIAFDGANIWVTNRNSHDVTKLRASDGAHLGTFPVVQHPAGVAFDGANIWVANLLADSISRF